MGWRRDTIYPKVSVNLKLGKEVIMDCKTLSNPHGVEKGYNIPKDECKSQTT